MLTRPAIFQDFQFNTSADRHVIVKVVSSGTTWLFSDIDMQLTDGHVYPLLRRGGAGISIGQSVDLYTRQWRLSDVSIALNNVDYLGQGALLSDEWGSLISATVTIYMATGGTVTALSDCLERFAGVVVVNPVYDVKTITLKATDKSKTNVVDLPTNFISDTTGLEGAGVGEVNNKVPIVYGDFSKAFDATADTGLAVAELFDWESQFPKVVVSDHALNAITKLFARVNQLPEPLQYLSATLTADDSGLGTALALSNSARVYLYPISNYVGDVTENDTPGTQRLNKNVGDIISAVDQGGTPNVVRFNTTASLESGLIASSEVVISGTTSYDGTYIITNLGSWWFEVEVAFVANETGTYTSDTPQHTQNILKAANQDDSDYASVKERSDDGDTLFAQAVLSLDNYATGNNLENNLGKITAMTAEIKINEGSGVVLDASGCEFNMVWGPDVDEDQGLSALVSLDGTTWNTVTLALGTDPIQIDVDGTSSDLGGSPNLVRIPSTGHGLSAGDKVYISGTTNYDGFYTLSAVAANTFDIESAHTAETFTLSAKVEEAPSIGKRVVWHWLSGHDLVGETDKEYPLVFLIQASTTTSNPVADGVVGNQEVLRIHEFRIKTDFDLVAKPRTYLVACEGLEYGAWISSRSSSYAAGDMIEDPAGIIESILRDQVGLATADIDEASFIAAENTAVKARINFFTGNEMDSNKAIRQITEQSTFQFFWSAVGKAKLIDLSDTTPTTATRGSHPVVIPFSHIKNDSIKVSKEPKIFNDITYKSRWQQEYKAFRDTDNVTDATSISNYGTREYVAKWKNIAGTSADTIAAFLVGANGIWSNQHNVLQFEMLGYTGADIEIGDWIELSSDVDPHIKAFGTSWSGLQFLVVALTQTEDGTRIKAIELFG